MEKYFSGFPRGACYWLSGSSASLIRYSRFYADPEKTSVIRNDFQKRTGLETTRTLVKFLRKNAFFAQTDRTKLCDRSEQGDTAPNRGKLVLELFGSQSLCPVLRVAWKICRQLGTHLAMALLSQHPRKVISPTLKFAAPVCSS